MIRERCVKVTSVVDTSLKQISIERLFSDPFLYRKLQRIYYPWIMSTFIRKFSNESLNFTELTPRKITTQMFIFKISIYFIDECL